MSQPHIHGDHQSSFLAEIYQIRVVHLVTCRYSFAQLNASCRTAMLNIMTSNPIVTMISRANPNQPRTIAVVPTPLSTLPFPRSCAIMEAATDAVCCQRTETRTKIDETKMMARAI